MPNWCYSQVVFSGDEDTLKRVKLCFVEMQKKGNETNEGQLPPFLKNPIKDWFFDVYADEDDQQITYYTKWAPNVEDLVIIADHFNAGFTVDYQERGSAVYGKSIYDNGVLNKYDLHEGEQDRITYDDDEETYYLDGNPHESEEELLEQLFEEKFKMPY